MLQAGYFRYVPSFDPANLTAASCASACGLEDKQFSALWANVICLCSSTFNASLATQQACAGNQTFSVSQAYRPANVDEMEFVPINGTVLGLYHDTPFAIQGNITKRDMILFRQRYDVSDLWENVDPAINTSETFMMPGPHVAELMAASSLAYVEVSCNMGSAARGSLLLKYATSFLDFCLITTDNPKAQTFPSIVFQVSIRDN